MTNPSELSSELFDILKSLNHEKFLDDVTNELSCFDIVDLIEKISLSRFYVTVSLIESNENDRGTLREIFDYALSFLFPLAMCHKFNGDKKADSSAVLRICKKIHENKVYQYLVHLPSGHDSSTINYLQDNLTDTLEPFKDIPVVWLLSCEDSLIKEKYGVNCLDIFESCCTRFAKGFYAPIINEQVSLENFIDNIDSYFDRKFFEIEKDDKCFEIIKDLSSNVGEFEIDSFSEASPLSILNLKRKLFLRKNGTIYNFHSDFVCNRLARCIESLFTKKEEKTKWVESYKERTEELPQAVLEKFFPGGKYHKNLYYKDDFGNLCECDGIFEYHDFLFTIEVKGNKFNPDPIALNENEVRESYDNVVNKVNDQSARIRKALSKQNDFNILDFKGNTIDTVADSNKKNLISLCVFFEDIGTYLSGTRIDQAETIFISFYDLYLVLHSIENPLLLIQYFSERSQALKDKRMIFNDELTYISMFCHYFHFSAKLNDSNAIMRDIPVDANIDDIYFCNDDFGMDVEIDLLSGKKANIEMPNFIKKIVAFKNYEELDDNVFFALEFLLSQSKDDWIKIEKSYLDGNKGKNRLPRFFYFEKEGEKGSALMLIARPHNQYESVQNIAYAREYFKYRSDKEFDICMISIGKDYSEYLKINKTDDLMNNEILDSYTNGISFTIREHIKF